MHLYIQCKHKIYLVDKETGEIIEQHWRTSEDILLDLLDSKGKEYGKKEKGSRQRRRSKLDN